MPRRILVAGLTLGLAFVIGCGEDDTVNQADPVPPPEDSEMYHHTDICEDDEQSTCVFTVSVGDDRDLAARLVGPEGDPHEDALVDFDLERVDGAEATDLSAGSDFTDENGVAEVTFRAGGDDEAQASTGEVEVTATVQDDDEVNTLDWNIGITPKGQAAYHVEFDHTGESSPDRVIPMFFDSDTSCEDARTEFFEDGGWPTAEFVEQPSTVNPDGTINDATLHPVDNNTSYTVIGVAEAEKGSEYVDVAYGCNDDNEPVQDGMDVTVEVELNDHIPHLGDRYDTINQFTLTDALPGPIQSVVDILGTLAENPAAFIIGGEDHTGLIDDILLPYLPDSLVEDYIQPILDNQGVVDVIHGFINEWLDEQMPDWLTDAQQVVGDVTDAIEDFTVAGQIYFDEQPTPELDDDGQAVGHVEEVRHLWDDVIFQWGLGCDDAADFDECAQVSIGVEDMGAGQEDVIEGHFDATLSGSSHVDIERHSLTLHYGALMMAAFEQMVLPRIFDESVTSLDGVIEYLIGDCEDFAAAVAEEESALEGAAENMCEELMGQATDALYDYVEQNLQAGGDEDTFALETPADEPCSMQQPEEYVGGSWPGEPLPYIETFGMADDGMECVWDVDVNLMGDEATELGGNFEGELSD